MAKSVYIKISRYTAFLAVGIPLEKGRNNDESRIKEAKRHKNTAESIQNADDSILTMRSEGRPWKRQKRLLQSQM